LALLFAVLSAVGGSWLFGGLFAQSQRPTGEMRSGSSADAIDWVPFSAATMESLLGEGRPVFVDFTADWCITCKVNERLAINTPAVRAFLREADIVPVKADWTNSDPEITAALAEFGRVGVPFYLFYPQGNARPPVTFPELLTEGLVLDRLRGALDPGDQEQATPTE
jgi:thiol:disulfide interchange protein DsbD